MLASPQRVRPPVPQIVRIAVICNLLKLLTTSYEWKHWYTAVSVLDMCTYRLNADHFIQDLPFNSIAIFRWVQSADVVRAKKPLVECIECALSVAQWLYSTGHIVETLANMTIEEFRTKEKQLFLSSKGICCWPSAHEWLLVLFTRLEVLTQNAYTAFLRPAWNRCHVFLHMATLVLDTTDLKFPASRVSCGLFMHSLVALRLLPVEMLRPSSEMCVDWEMLFVESQPEGLRAALPCLLAADSVSVFVQQVQVAAGVDFAKLTQDSFNMAAFMRDAFRVLRAWNGTRS